LASDVNIGSLIRTDAFYRIKKGPRAWIVGFGQLFCEIWRRNVLGGDILGDPVIDIDVFYQMNTILRPSGNVYN